MINVRFRKMLSAGTLIGAFCSVGVLSAQSFVPQQEGYEYQDIQNSQIQNFEQTPQFGVPQQQNPQDSWRVNSSFPFNDPNQPQQTQYLACMQAAELRKEQVAVQLYAWMYQQKTLARQRQAQGRVAAWSIPDDRARRDALRQVDTEYRDVLRAIDRQFDDIADEILDRYRDESRDCNRLKNSRDSSQSSSYSSQWWQPFPSSLPAFNPAVQGGQQSSTFFQGGFDGTHGCTPMKCSDGRTIPRCTIEGYPINYTADPCTFS